jgi:hypothetical protein
VGRHHRARSGQFDTHSVQRTGGADLRRTGNLRAVQLLLGHSKIESPVLGIEVDDDPVDCEVDQIR